MPIFCLLVTVLGLMAIYGLIRNLFNWKGYDYLFVSYCLVGTCLTTVVNFLKIRVDCVVIFSYEIYKYFLLIIGTTIFGIIAVEKNIDSLVIGIAWVLFVFRAKASLPR